MPIENVTPFEIIVAPFEAWTGVANLAQPNVYEAPGAGWAKLGKMGSVEYTDDGVTVAHPQSVNLIRGQATAPLKAARTEEGLTITFNLMDLTVESYKYAMDGNPISETGAQSGIPGYRTIDLYRGPIVGVYALLLRGPSPYMDMQDAQYYVPRAFIGGEPEVVFNKGEAAALAFEFQALYDETAAVKFAQFRAIHQGPLP